MNEDIEIIGTDIFWSASKNKSYRALIKCVFGTLVDFLQSNDLVTKPLLTDDDEVGENFVIRRADLTDEGYEFYRRVEQPWFNAIDNGVAPTSTVILERALKELRRGG